MAVTRLTQPWLCRQPSFSTLAKASDPAWPSTEAARGASSFRTARLGFRFPKRFAAQPWRLVSTPPPDALPIRHGANGACTRTRKGSKTAVPSRGGPMGWSVLQNNLYPALFWAALCLPYLVPVPFIARVPGGRVSHGFDFTSRFTLRIALPGGEANKGQLHYRKFSQWGAPI